MMVINIKLTIPGWVERIVLPIALVYRRVRYGYTFRRIPLTQGKYAIVDCDDYERLHKFNWHAKRCPNGWYVMRTARGEERRTRQGIWMHWAVIEAPKGMIIDHWNHNGLDNRKANLRVCTFAENVRNRRKMRRPCSSRFKGVSFKKGRELNHWYTEISINGRKIFLGRFGTEIEAAKAYDEAAKKYHKEFASLNFTD
jgi:hypothetical protein